MRNSLLLVTLFAMIAASCGEDRYSRRSRRSRLLPRGEEPAGITELTELLDEFHENIEDADFDDAAELVEDMEEKVKRADVATISHSDYAELSAAVERAGAELRAAKKQHAIDQIVDETQEKLADAGELNEEIIGDGPNDDDLDELDERLDDLAELVEKGEPYRDDIGFAEFAQKRDVRIATFSTTAKQYRWLLGAKRKLNDALDGATREIEDDADMDDRIEYADDMLAHYEACVEATRELALANGFAKNLTIEMPIGEMNLQKTQDVCESRRTSHEATGHNLRWKRGVLKLATAVSESLKNIEAQEKVEDQLEANEAAVGALDECATKLAKTEEHPGFDKSYLFTTHMGKSSSARLRDNCAKVRDNLEKLQPTLRWRIAVEKVKAAHFESKQEVAEAGAEKDPGDRVDQLSDTLDGFRECTEKAKVLTAMKKKEYAGASPKKSELRFIASLVSTCQKDIERVENLIAAAEKAMSPEAKAKKKDRRKKKKRRKKKR